MQIIVVLVITGLWAISLIVAAFDGSTLARLLTPAMTMILGWLFAERATSSE